MVGEDDTTEVVDPVQADLEVRLARLWSAIEMLDRHSWRVLEGVVVDDDARASLTAAYTSATAAARANGLTGAVGTAVRATLAVVATIEGEASWAAKRWVEYAATALVCRTLLLEDLVTGEGARGDPDVAPRLVGGDFGWVEYEILTCTWRSVVGEVHPDDPPLVEDPPEEPDEEWWLGSADDLPDGEHTADDLLVDQHPAGSARERVDALWDYLVRPARAAAARHPAAGRRSGRPPARRRHAGRRP